MVDVCVVIVTRNHRSFIGPCVESILNSQCSCSFKLFVVDDGSTDNTRIILEAFGDRLILITRDGEHSFASNNNIVLQSVNAKYFLLLNPDTILPENGINNLYDFMKAHSDAGACGPKLIYPDGSLQLSCRRFPTPITFLLRRTPFRFFLPKKSRGKRHLIAAWEHDKVRHVDWLLAACIILRTEALKSIGYFDERFRLYCEDIDLCFRLWENGWSVYYNPNVVVIHHHQAKSDRHLFSKYSFWHYCSMLRYIKKHGFEGFRRPHL